MVYLIDDDVSVIRGVELFLKSAGLEFKSFQSAEVFLSSANPSTNDIIILDLNLPGIRGNDLLKIFHQKGLRIPVIVVTASDSAKSAAYCRKYGVKAYLRKPVDAEALLDLINYNLAM